ncbi:HGGxSTG domain-containing protein [Thermomonas sp.]|uniref:HGGxSTG domain-containing protein n=1 Tax=Thermomonas sp. TaxID=1971895 RepID=UPI00261699AD|nr:HGGxSTG domain-containing protein [Thermomonas sp.]MCO5054435.1 hypothetical protein [Thermomonas sp.]
MTDASDGYLSRNKPYLARLQRERRARLVRIDYMPGDDALAIIEAKRGTYYPLNTNSGIIDAILTEWATLTGTKWGEVRNPMSPEFPVRSAHARMTSVPESIARAQESGDLPDVDTHSTGWQSAYLARVARAKSTARVTCGAKRHRDGQPCQAKSEPGKRRCRFHGGRSTGPKTPEGKARALANLRQNRRIDE